MLAGTMVKFNAQKLVAELIEDTRPGEFTIEMALELFNKVYMASRNLTKRTRVEYNNDLKQLGDFLAKHKITEPSAVNLLHLQAFLAYLDREGYAGVTRRRKTTALKTFFKFLAQNRLIADNPARRLIPPKREYKKVRFLTTRECQVLRQACAHKPRDAAIIELILQTGIRLSEIVRLTLDDVELPQRIDQGSTYTGRVFIQGKGRKQRTLFLSHKACCVLKSYFSVRPQTDNRALFVTRFHQPMQPRAFQQVVAKCLTSAGVKNASVHTLRHSFAVHRLANGTSPKVLQNALGLDDIEAYVLAAEAMKRDLKNHTLWD